LVTGLLAILFLANFGFASISRSALVVAPVLAILLGWWLFRWKGILGACVIAIIIGAGFWVASPALRTRVHESVDEMHQYLTTNAATSLGLHTAWAKDSLEIIALAPIIGHGTGSIPEQFRRITAQHGGDASFATVNPHNQTFAVAIQVGIAGALVLWAMWIAHVRLFRGDGMFTWIGIVLVTENIVSSITASHLFDFANGWLYVFGIGVLGGMVLREQERRIDSGN
jgi:O-antigen ligase